MVDSHTCIENELGVKPLLSGKNISNLELTRNTTDKFEITQMFFIANSTIWINLEIIITSHKLNLFRFPHLECVIVSCRVFEQSIVRVEHLLGQEIEPLPGNTTVVKADLQGENRKCLLNSLKYEQTSPSNSIHNFVLRVSTLLDGIE